MSASGARRRSRGRQIKLEFGGSIYYITLCREFGGEGLLHDVNYLGDLFRKQMALAAERVFTHAAAGGPLEKAVAAVLS